MYHDIIKFTHLTKRELFCLQIFIFKFSKGSTIFSIFKHTHCLNVWKHARTKVIKKEATMIFYAFWLIHVCLKFRFYQIQMMTFLIIYIIYYFDIQNPFIWIKSNNQLKVQKGRNIYLARVLLRCHYRSHWLFTFKNVIHRHVYM